MRFTIFTETNPKTTMITKIIVLALYVAVLFLIGIFASRRVKT